MSYYNERYEEIVRLPFIAEKKTPLCDHADEASRRCRFCGCGKPEKAFSNTAHAVPGFLGNRDILSLNECDSCNQSLGENYEHHLARWSLCARSVSQVKGKKQKPTFKNPGETMRIEAGEDGLNIHLTDQELASDLMKEDGPYQFELPADATSKPYIPIRAAMALVKIACSVCPPDELGQCRPAIEWLMQRGQFHMSNFPVLYAFTPGPINRNASEVRLLRRKAAGPEPYLWSIVQFSNHRLQTFVPFCHADADWLRMGESTRLTAKHYPSQFGPDWQFGKTEYSLLDWSESEYIQTSATVTFQVDHATRTYTPDTDD